MCTETNGTSIDCTNDITQFYLDIGKSLSQTSDKVLNNDEVRDEYKCHQVYGWNIYVKEANQIARYAYSIWRTSGKTRYGPCVDNMTKSRAQFKYALRFCKKNKELIESNKIAS